MIRGLLGVSALALASCSALPPSGELVGPRRADVSAPVVVGQTDGRGTSVELGGQRVLAAVPGTVDLAGVTGCELVELVLVGQLGLSASCSGVGGSYSLASWYPDAGRLLRLTIETLRAGGAVVQVEQAGIVVSGSGSERGASGATVSATDVPDGADLLAGVGAVSPAGGSDLAARARAAVPVSSDLARVIEGSADTLRGLIDVGGLDVSVSDLRGGRSVIRGSFDDLELLEELAAGREWVAHALPGVAGGPEALAWLAQSYGISAEAVGGRVVLRGRSGDVVAALGGVRDLGLMQVPRAVDLALVVASVDQLRSAGVELGASISGGDYVVRAGSVAQPGLSVTLDHVRSASSLSIAERPSLSVRDGQPARISVGLDVPVQVQGESENEGPSFEYRQTGTVVTVTTEPGVGQLVRADVSVEVSSVDGTGVGGNPVIAQRRYDAQLELEPGRVHVVAVLDSARKTQDNNRGLLTFGHGMQEGAALLTVLIEVRRDRGK